MAEAIEEIQASDEPYNNLVFLHPNYTHLKDIQKTRHGLFLNGHYLENMNIKEMCQPQGVNKVHMANGINTLFDAIQLYPFQKIVDYLRQAGRQYCKKYVKLKPSEWDATKIAEIKGDILAILPLHTGDKSDSKKSIALLNVVCELTRFWTMLKLFNRGHYGVGWIHCWRSKAHCYKVCLYMFLYVCICLYHRIVCYVFIQQYLIGINNENNYKAKNKCGPDDKPCITETTLCDAYHDSVGAGNAMHPLIESKFIKDLKIFKKTTPKSTTEKYCKSITTAMFVYLIGLQICNECTEIRRFDIENMKRAGMNSKSTYCSCGNAYCIQCHVPDKFKDETDNNVEECKYQDAMDISCHWCKAHPQGIEAANRVCYIVFLCVYCTNIGYHGQT